LLNKYAGKAKVAKVLDLIPASSESAKCEGRQMKLNKVHKKEKIKKISL
jgi:hypothetical protein